MPLPHALLEGHRGLRDDAAARRGRPRGDRPYRRMPPSPATGSEHAGPGMSVLGFCTVAGAVMVASCLQASIGFGIGMLAAPVIALVDPRLIPGTLIMIATVVTLIVVVREREDIDLH